jgi:putative flavoprotein involved in K+ transport
MSNLDTNLRTNFDNNGDTGREIGTATAAHAPASARTRVGTLVIGAGQAGLATAYHLGRAGDDCLVVHEHRRVGDQWRLRYDSLLLNTPAQYDDLPGMPFPAPRHSFPTGREMADYLEAYVERHRIEVLHETVVRSVLRLEDGTYRVDCGGRPVIATNVVVATGGEKHPRVPEIAGQLDPGIRQLHSSDYRNPGQLLPGPTLVVGAGQSGADLALEVARAGHETVLSGRVNGEVPFRLGTRKSRRALPVLIFLAHHVLTTKTPIGRRLQPKIRAGGTPLVRVKVRDLEEAGVRMLPSRTTGVVEGRPQLEDATVLEVDNVIWCTGFRQDFDLIHPPVTRADGWPDDRGGVVPSSPGLFFVGLLFQRGFYSMLIGGAGRDARYIARQIHNRR